VPNRLVWNHWVNFMGERVDADDSIDYTVPIVNAPTTTGFGEESLYDYMGIPNDQDGFSVANLVPRSYNLIWNEWFRSPWLQDAVVVDLDDGPDDPTDYTLLRRGKRADYFTSCLPSPQRVTDTVDLPLGASAPVVLDSNYSGLQLTKRAVTHAAQQGTLAGNGSGQLEINSLSGLLDLNSSHYADLSSATSASINDIREAFALQRILELEARSGTRYTEILQSVFGVYPEDQRLNRPEYLGGGSRPLQIEAIPQTSETNTTAQGNLSGVGYNQTHGIGYSRSFREHGHIIGLCSVRADQTYQQGLRRMWSRNTRFDFYRPELANLGEMAVLNKEIMVQGTSADDEVFGYMPHWDDLRYFPSIVTGKMRSTSATSLDPWHLAPEFATLPTLGPDFIEEDPPIDRVVAVNTEPQFILDAYFDITSARPLPMFSVPSLQSHF